ncbi:MAG TPA: hypothetical protein VFT37_05420, partial [Telluria sp.]|nr:hypothetical protein [Telluria sp.]
DWESSEKMTNAKEKQAKQAELIESGTANLTRMVEGGKLEAEMKALDAAKKKMVGTALTNFAIGGLQAVGLTKTGQSIIQKAGSNPMNLTKIGPVKDALPILAKVMKDSGGLMAGLVKVAKGANIEIAAVKEDSKPTSFTF